MAKTYDLLCIDCRRYLSFGKVYWRDAEGLRIGQVTFDGIYDPQDHAFHKRDEFFGRVVEKFLITHRNHELRFVPEGVDELLEDECNIFEPDDAHELLAQEGVAPDWEKELVEWNRKLRGD